VTHVCSTPGCSTLTFGDLCLGCLQRRSESQGSDGDDYADRADADETRADAATAAA
jgi:hypothetical protein